MDLDAIEVCCGCQADADLIDTLIERIRALEAENERLRNRTIGQKFDDLMNNLPPESPIDYAQFLEDD